jgi:hypothetical protein
MLSMESKIGISKHFKIVIATSVRRRFTAENAEIAENLYGSCLCALGGLCGSCDYDLEDFKIVIEGSRHLW